MGKAYGSHGLHRLPGKKCYPPSRRIVEPECNLTDCRRQLARINRRPRGIALFLLDLAQGPFVPGGGGLSQVALKVQFWRGEAALRNRRKLTATTGISPRGAASPPEPRRGRAAGLASQALRKRSARGRRRGPQGEIPQEMAIHSAKSCRPPSPQRSRMLALRLATPSRPAVRFAPASARPPAPLRIRRFGRRGGTRRRRRREPVGQSTYESAETASSLSAVSARTPEVYPGFCVVCVLRPTSLTGICAYSRSGSSAVVCGKNRHPRHPRFLP